MNPEDPAQDLDQLLMELLDGELSPVQRLHLMALLRDDPAARERYVEYLYLDSLLGWELSLTGRGLVEEAKSSGRPVAVREAIEAQAPAPESRGSAPWLRAWSGRITWASGLVALILILIVGFGRWRRSDPSPITVATGPIGAGPANDSTREPRAGGLAILTRVVDVIWEDKSPEPAVGSILSEGILQLRSGVVQIEFYSGATIILEGPAEVEMKASDRIACRYGKLRALVPPRAHGFRVDSSSVDLVDLGTEFGIQVVRDRKSEVHVFQGKVELHKATPGPGQQARWELAEGNGLRIGIAGDVTPLAADSPAFLTPPDLDRLYRKESGRRYREWETHSRDFANDRRLVTYFSFEGDREPGSRVLVSRYGDGAIVGCEWVDGRWPGKGALEFKRPSDRVRIDVAGEFQSLTFACWVRIDAIEHRFNSLMLTDGFEPGEIHWQIDRLGRLILGVRNALPITRKDSWSLGQKNYTSLPVITPEKFGRWIHLATAYDHRAQRVTHYVDGAAVWSEPLAWNIALRIGAAELGNWTEVPYEHDPAPIRNLCGRMDEFALFRVALSPDEVRELYKRGN